jgi:type IV pilus assembly protein PilW
MAHPFKRQAGLTLVELMVAMAISLIIVVAAAYVYVASRESQRAIDRTSGSLETGAFVVQMLGREIMNAGFYPATVAPLPPEATQIGMYDTYAPLPSEPRQITDWANPGAGWPPTAFISGIYGCDGGKLDVASSTCASPDATAADTLVINYFTSDALGNGAGRRTDCTGANVSGDPSNTERAKNSGGSPPATPHTTPKPQIPPQLPLFVSNRFALSDTKISIDQGDINTKSLACSGNGSSPHGKANSTAYQPIIHGVEDLQFTYGVYSGEDSLTPERFYTATELNALGSLTLNGLTLSPWQRVTAVRVCVLTKTLGGKTRIADKSGSARKYLDCSNTQKDQPKGDTITRNVEVFGLRNGLKQYY